jgi:hypothetical protein
LVRDFGSLAWPLIGTFWGREGGGGVYGEKILYLSWSKKLLSTADSSALQRVFLLLDHSLIRLISHVTFQIP